MASGVAFGIGDEQPIRQIDLVGGEADAFVLVHQLEHFGDDLPQLGIDAAERLRAVPQCRVGILDDLESQRSVRGGETGSCVKAGRQSQTARPCDLGQLKRVVAERQAVQEIIGAKVPAAKRD